MPRFVDHEQRRADIVKAAAAVLAESGYGNFSIRAVATRLGGSTTLVTHYFASREDLITALTNQVFEETEAEHDHLLAITNPLERLRASLEYFLPLDADDLEEERIRIALIPYRETDAAVAEFLNRLEDQMRAVLRTGIGTLVPEPEVEQSVSMLRAWVNGLALSAVEHPELWNSHQLQVAMDRFIHLLGLNS